MGEKIFTTNLKDPLSYQFITFKSKYIDSVNSIYIGFIKKTDITGVVLNK